MPGRAAIAATQRVLQIDESPMDAPRILRCRGPAALAHGAAVSDLVVCVCVCVCVLGWTGAGEGQEQVGLQRLRVLAACNNNIRTLRRSAKRASLLQTEPSKKAPI